MSFGKYIVIHPLPQPSFRTFPSSSKHPLLSICVQYPALTPDSQLLFAAVTLSFLEFHTSDIQKDFSLQLDLSMIQFLFFCFAVMNNSLDICFHFSWIAA
jgi:hypothetical protein